jgi:hypothetical protein
VLWESNEGTVLLYYLANPPTGAQTVTASFTGMGTEAGGRNLMLASLTYSGVAGISGATTASNIAADAALTVPAASGQMVAQAFSCWNLAAGASFSSYSQTSRWSQASVHSSTASVVIGDAAGAALVPFTAVIPANEGWGGVGVPLVGTSVAFDAVGAGAIGESASLSYSHTIASGAAIVLFVNAQTVSGSAVPTLTPKVGTTPMTLLEVNPNYAGAGGQFSSLFVYGLLNPPSGSQTITVGISPTEFVGANSVSYTGVTQFGTPQMSTGIQNTLNVASTLPAARVVAAHGVTPMVNTFGYNGVKRAVVTYAGAEQLLMVGDAPGSSMVQLTANLSQTPGGWGAVGVNLTPAPVMLNCSTLIGPILTSARLADYRVHSPSPLRTWTIPAGQGQVVTTPFGIGQEWTQAYDAVLDYTLDWTEWLATTSDTITNVTFTPSDPAITVVSQNATADIATAWLTGGLNGNAYAIKVHIVTEFGRQDDRTFLLNIDQT